jgi:hypothetical protein
MTDTPIAKPSPVPASPRAAQLTRHLFQYPADLVDTRRLMRSFQASVAEVQQALDWLETHRPAPAQEAQEEEGVPGCCSRE